MSGAELGEEYAGEEGRGAEALNAGAAEDDACHSEQPCQFVSLNSIYEMNGSVCLRGSGSESDTLSRT